MTAFIPFHSESIIGLHAPALFLALDPSNRTTEEKLMADGLLSLPQIEPAKLNLPDAHKTAILNELAKRFGGILEEDLSRRLSFCANLNPGNPPISPSYRESADVAYHNLQGIWNGYQYQVVGELGRFELLFLGKMIDKEAAILKNGELAKAPADLLLENLKQAFPKIPFVDLKPSEPNKPRNIALISFENLHYQIQIGTRAFYASEAEIEPKYFVGARINFLP